MFIDKNTISSIKTLENGTAKLTFYKDCKPVFEKVYKSFTAARIAEGKLIRKYYK